VSAFVVGCGLVVAFCVSMSGQNGFGLLLCRPLPSPYRKGKPFFALYVGVASFNFPQDPLRERLLLAVATFFIACFGVGYPFSFHTLNIAPC
jgi:hypothetical protein